MEEPGEGEVKFELFSYTWNKKYTEAFLYLFFIYSFIF